MSLSKGNNAFPPETEGTVSPWGPMAQIFCWKKYECKKSTYNNKLKKYFNYISPITVLLQIFQSHPAGQLGVCGLFDTTALEKALA